MGAVTAVAGDSDQAEKASAFHSAFQALGNATFDAAEVLMFHAVPEMMEEGQGYDTLAGAAAGQLTINGDEVEGPCNTAKVAQTVEVCNSVVHVVSEVLLPADFCTAGSSEDTGKEDYSDGGGGDDGDEEGHEDHDHDEEDHDDSAEDGGEPSEDDAGDDEDDSGADGGEESADDAGDDEDDSGAD